MARKTYAYTDEWGNNYELFFVKTVYAYNNRTAILAVCQEEGESYWEPYTDVTVNLMETLSGTTYAFLDTNNSRHLIDWMVAQGLVELTGHEAISGFCTYPEGRFTDEFLAACEVEV